jgi:hypothetical protein
MALVMEGAVQQAPQPARQWTASKGEGGADSDMDGLSSRVARGRQRA